jgi:hypothetical protein
MAPRLSSVVRLATLLLVLTSLVAVDAVAIKPKPLVLKPATAKPKPNKPDIDIDISGGGAAPAPAPTPLPLPPPSVANYFLYLPCSNLDKALVMNPTDKDLQQCAAYSTYDFGSFAPTPTQKTLLCGQGCWSLLDRLMDTPIPMCSIALNGYAVNYIDALYVVFGACVADPTKANIVGTNSAPAVNTPAPVINTPPATNGAALNAPITLLVGAVAVCAMAMGF